jgi:molybdopterin converting factor small subunit
MTMVDVTLIGPIGEAAGTRKTQAAASTVGELLDVLSTRYGPVFTKRARASRIVVNGTPIQFKQGHKTPLNAGDEVALLVPVGGG